MKTRASLLLTKLEASSIAANKIKQLRSASKQKSNTKVSKQELNALEKTLDALFKGLKLDIEFSRHFLDRLNDARNRKQITIQELNDLFRKVHVKYGVAISKKDVDFEAVLRSLSTSVNIPFVLNVGDHGMIELVSKTIMRKKDFKTPDMMMSVK